jgi:hypothetical protein
MLDPHQCSLHAKHRVNMCDFSLSFDDIRENEHTEEMLKLSIMNNPNC